MQALVDGKLDGVSHVALRSGNELLDQVRIGHYWATDGVSGWNYQNPGANVYVDTVYLDTTFARVELGNSASYQDCTHREIQLVTAWSDSEVSFELKPGSLPAGPVWVFVIGADNQVKASGALTLP